jgi:hypothetical protein
MGRLDVVGTATAREAEKETTRGEFCALHPPLSSSSPSLLPASSSSALPALPSSPSSSPVDAVSRPLFAASQRRITSAPQRDTLTPRVVALYTEQHLTVREIGRVVGMSGQAVHRRLQKAGITREQGERIVSPCAYCGVEVNRPRSRGFRREAMYCTAEHYYASRGNPAFRPWRQGGRLARAIVSQHYPLSRDEVVHHVDGDQRHNDLSNLAVYASHADHLAAHHGRQIDPVWRGRDAGLSFVGQSEP